MGLFDFFKKKKGAKYNNYEFNFSKAPQLLEIYGEYKKHKNSASSSANKESSKKGEYEKASKKRDDFGRNTFAKAIWEIFNPIAPTLYNSDKEENVSWNEVFSETFEELSTRQKDFLVGLIERNYIYELPKEYYNNRNY